MPLHPPELEWLKKSASRVSTALAERLPVGLWRRPASIEDTLHASTNFDGFVAQLGALRGDHGSQLQIWIDRWSDGKTLRVAYGYRSTNPKRVEAFRQSEYRGAKAVAGSRIPVLLRSHSTLARMHPVLKVSECGRPLLEVNHQLNEWSYVSAYEWGSPSLTAAPSARSIRRIVDFLEWVARAAVARPEQVYANENQRRVTQHLRRERSAGLARAVKYRDRYTCRVCECNLEDVYGPVAQGVADAHHIKPLSQLKKAQVTKLDDLITVCPNCHRVLHQMEGQAGDWRALRKLYLKRNA